MIQIESFSVLPKRNYKMESAVPLVLPLSGKLKQGKPIKNVVQSRFTNPGSLYRAREKYPVSYVKEVLFSGAHQFAIIIFVDGKIVESRDSSVFTFIRECIEQPRFLLDDIMEGVFPRIMREYYQGLKNCN